MEHELTESRQGSYKYTIGPYADPVLEVDPGDRITVETKDAFGGRVPDEQTRPSDVIEHPYVNPVNGPIYVRGAKKGDALAVRVENMLPRGDQPRGTSGLVENFGGLTPTDHAPALSEPLPELVKKFHVTTEGVRFNDDITLPYEPFVGTIGTAPEIDSVNTLTPGRWGGNMDLPDTGPGSTVYLPVNVEGGYLYLGDCHGQQGDGELNGSAVEMASVTTITVEVVENWPLEWPRLETDDFIMSIGSARPMEDAARIAYHDLLRWMVKDHGWDRWEAYFLLTQIGRVRLGNMVDPNYSMGARIDKEYV